MNSKSGTARTSRLTMSFQSRVAMPDSPLTMVVAISPSTYSVGVVLISVVVSVSSSVSVCQNSLWCYQGNPCKQTYKCCFHDLVTVVDGVFFDVDHVVIHGIHISYVESYFTCVIVGHKA